eukprot:7944812-Alexandrium_andersonii.AAC.1
MDGEGGVAQSADTEQFLAKNGMQYAPRAPGQEVAHIDRRTALLRDVIHRAVEQLKHEGLSLPFDQILSEC